MNDQEKIKLLSDFHRACLELDWAKHGRAVTATKRFNVVQKAVLTYMLGRRPTNEEIAYYDNL